MQGTAVSTIENERAYEKLSHNKDHTKGPVRPQQGSPTPCQPRYTGWVLRTVSHRMLACIDPESLGLPYALPLRGCMPP